MRDFSLEVYFSRWEFNCEINLAGSDAESLSLQELLALGSDADRQAFENTHLGYTETYGSPSLREAIAGTYDSVSREDVLCFAGAEEAIYTVNRVVLGPEDHAVVITPNYQAAETVPLSICEISGVALDIDRGWELDIDAVRAAIRPNTRLVSINFPNNPTGKIIPRASLDALIAMCREQGIWLFSDEVYRLFERDESLRLPQAVDLYERGISLNVMSKAYGLPGLRIGWLACKDREMLARFERYKHYLSICNSAPSEALARIAIQARDAILSRNRAIVASNRKALDKFFANHSNLFEWRQPDGGCVGFIRYKGRDGVEAFTRRLVEESGVLLLPSSVFRSEVAEVPADCIRIGFGHSNVPEGLERLERWLARSGNGS